MHLAVPVSSPPNGREGPARGARADIFLVKRRFAASRAQARQAIEAGNVRADGILITKPSQFLCESAAIDYTPAHSYVSRGALKLIAALDRFQFTPKGKVCLDLGASAGGFTQLLLERGAICVYAVDVGTGQLHPSLASDRRVVSLEGVNARQLSSETISEPIEAVVADVSFISLKLALPPALALARGDAWLVALVKPQFEAGRSSVGKSGIVRDARMRSASVRAIVEWLPSLGWTVEGQIESPIKGGSGNIEFLIGARR